MLSPLISLEAHAHSLALISTSLSTSKNDLAKNVILIFFKAKKYKNANFAHLYCYFLKDKTVRFFIVIILLASISLFTNSVLAQGNVFRMGSGATMTVNPGYVVNIYSQNTYVDAQAMLLGTGKIILSPTTPLASLTMGYVDQNYALKNYPVFNGQLEFRLPGKLTLNGDLRVMDTALFTKGLLTMGNNTVNLAGAVETQNGALTGNSKAILLMGDNLSNVSTLSNVQFDQAVAGQTNILDSFQVSAGTVRIDNNLNISNVLSIAPSNALVNANNNLTMLSTAYQTSRITASNPAGGYLEGTMYVQRYFPVINAFTLLTAPLTSPSALISNSWQLGTSIYGPGGAANGFSGNQDTTMYFLSSGSPAQWSPIPNTNNTYITDYLGYLIRVIAPVRPTILMAYGLPSIGNQSFTVSPSSVSLIPNPFASSISFDQLYQLATNTPLIKQAVKVFDPSLGSNGGFISNSWNSLTNNYDQAPLSNLNRIIQSGQAFIVEPIQSGMLEVTEDMKIPGSSLLPFSNQGQNPQPTTPISNLVQCRVNLRTFNTGTSPNSSIVDGVLLNANDLYDPTDPSNYSLKLPNVTENISILSNSKNYTIVNVPMVNELDTTQLMVDNIQGLSSYQLELYVQNFSNTSIQPYLYDRLNPNDLLVLPDNQDVLYTANINSNPNSYATNRFAIVYGLIPRIAFIDLNGELINNAIQINFAMNNEYYIAHYRIEKLNLITNQFDSIAVVLPRYNNNTKQSFNFTDNNVFGIKSTYRITAIRTKQLSPVVSPITTIYQSKNEIAPIIAIPNPFTTKLSVQFNEVPTGSYTISLFSLLGQLLSSQQVTYTGGIIIYPIDLPVALPNAGYYITVKGLRASYSIPAIKNQNQ
ncbi:MAG: hypothetical protein QM528_09170 [Phycisphaerales bacterium]|nr:hypothetical protein [Phycisphaerales bacterium]